jgi:hypothetical protein
MPRAEGSAESGKELRYAATSSQSSLPATGDSVSFGSASCGDKVLIGWNHALPEGFWDDAFERGPALSCYSLEDGSLLWRSFANNGRGYGACCTERGVMKILQAGPEPRRLGQSELRRPVATVEVADGIVVMAQHRSLMCDTNPQAQEAKANSDQ